MMEAPLKAKTNSSESFQQCTKCGRYLLGSRLSQSDHVVRCFQTETLHSSSSPMDFKTLEMDKKPLHWIVFPSLIISLERCQLPIRQVSSPVVTKSTKLARRRELRAKQEEEKTPRINTYKFNCNLCPGKFYSTVEYNRHMNVHNGTRRIMTCIICLRMFNKRDSLNSHYAAHENAEEREIKLDLLHSPWKKPEYDKDNPCVRGRQACKYCLLVHGNQHSYVHHNKTDHKHVTSFPCRLDECRLEFDSIKDLLSHSKSVHSLSFYGQWTLNRIREAELSENLAKKGLREWTIKGPSKKATPKPKSNYNCSRKAGRKKRTQNNVYSSDYETQGDMTDESFPVLVTTTEETAVKEERIDIDEETYTSEDGLENYRKGK